VLEDGRTLLTTNHVASETYTLLRMRLGSSAAQEFLSRSRISATTQRVFVPEAWEEAAEDLLIRYGDQDLSYVDATSFIAMRRLGLQEALAFDHHFSVLGFVLISG
jgi:predicted nucleic acid-binding protein